MAEQNYQHDRIPTDQNPTIRLCDNLMGQVLISVKKEQDMGKRAVEKLSSEREKMTRELQRINTETLENHDYDEPWSIEQLDSKASSSLVQLIQRTIRNREQMMRSVCQNQEAHRVDTMLLLLELVNTDKVGNESLNAMIRHAQEGKLVCSSFVRMLVQQDISVPACIEMVANDQGEFWPAYRRLTRTILTQLDVWLWCERAYETIMTCSPARFPALLKRNNKHEHEHEPQDNNLCIRYKASRYQMTGLRAWPNGGFSVYLENSETKMLQVALSQVMMAGNAKQAESNTDYIFQTCAAAFDSKDDEDFMLDKSGNAATGMGIIHRLPLSITCKSIIPLDSSRSVVHVRCRNGDMVRNQSIDLLRKMGPHIRQKLAATAADTG